MSAMLRSVLAGLAAVTVSVAVPAGATAAESCVLGPEDRLPGDGGLIRVPQDYPQIRDAVEHASEGDTVLVGPGSYEGGIEVTTPGLRIRGTDREGVVVDGKLAPRAKVRSEPVPQNYAGFAFSVMADRVMVENMTLRNFQHEAIAWRPRISVDGDTVQVDPVEHFWGRYLTVAGAGHTTVLSAGGRCGQLDHIVATGAAFGGITVQGCDPCDTVVTESVAKGNGAGFIALDANRGMHFGVLDGSGDDTRDDNVATGNHIGFFAGLEDPAHWPPPDGDPRVLIPGSGRGPVIRDNVVEANNSLEWPVPCAPTSAGCQSLTEGYNGTGMMLMNTRGALVEGNTVRGNRRNGIQIAGLWYPATGNTVRDNTATGNGWDNGGAGWAGADLFQDTIVGPGNCWERNIHDRAEPLGLEIAWSCGLPATPPGGGVTAGVRCRTWIEPGEVPPTVATCWSAPRKTRNWWQYKPPTDAEATKDAPPDDGAVDEWLPALKGLSTG